MFRELYYVYHTTDYEGQMLALSKLIQYPNRQPVGLRPLYHGNMVKLEANGWERALILARTMAQKSGSPTHIECYEDGCVNYVHPNGNWGADFNQVVLSTFIRTKYRDISLK